MNESPRVRVLYQRRVAYVRIGRVDGRLHHPRLRRPGEAGWVDQLHNLREKLGRKVVQV